MKQMKVNDKVNCNKHNSNSFLNNNFGQLKKYS